MIRIARFVCSLFWRPPVLQVAAICLRRSGAELEVLLVRSRESRRWVTPKGWPMNGKTLAQAAEIEAWEEAGVRGHIGQTHFGTFRYDKKSRGGAHHPCEVRTFLLWVDEEVADFPEATERARHWFSAVDAARAVDEPELARLILRADTESGQKTL